MLTSSPASTMRCRLRAPCCPPTTIAARSVPTELCFRRYNMFATRRPPTKKDFAVLVQHQAQHLAFGMLEKFVTLRNFRWVDQFRWWPILSARLIWTWSRVKRVVAVIHNFSLVWTLGLWLDLNRRLWLQINDTIRLLCRLIEIAWTCAVRIEETSSKVTQQPIQSSQRPC